MKTTHRSYSEESGDFNRLAHYLIQNRDHVQAHSTWCLSRLSDWKYGLYEPKTSVAAFCDRNAQLWFDGFGYLVGFAISENGDRHFAILTAQGHRCLFEEVLEWVLMQWSGRPGCLSMEITEHQAAEAALLERHGFANTCAFSTRGFDLTGGPIPPAPLEPGYAIVDMASHPDYRGQRVMRAEAFSDNPNPTEEQMQHYLEFYNYTHQSPIYHAETDLCVMAPDGRMVAGAEALIDAHNLCADVERVCTHSAFRRRGFARAVIVECMRRLAEMSMERAYITGYSAGALALYGSLGHVSEQKCFVYERPAAAG